MLVGTQERAAIWQFAASAAMSTFALAIFVDRQKACGRAFEFGRPGIFRKKFCFCSLHKYAT